MRKGGGNPLYIWIFMLVFCCVQRVRLDGTFKYKRVVIAKAGKPVIIKVEQKGGGDYELYIVYSRGLLGKRLRLKMERKDGIFRVKIPGGDKDDVFFFWIEVFKGRKIVGTIPDIERMRREFLREKPLSDILGRIEFK